jgi:hypothetical protein
MRHILLSGVAGLLLCAGGCAQKLDPINFTDVQSRREYRSAGNPKVSESGAVSFVDETSGKSVTLQSWEATDDTGRTYTTQWDPVRAQWRLVPGEPKKPNETDPK